ncbi:MAG: endonuclease/exonuclease/phosphatase family protein [Propionibacteriales bacterium]|nr:endonuclease/exonuclease/phosphatase family protein [Propionibacteriales bacterium]
MRAGASRAGVLASASTFVIGTTLLAPASAYTGDGTMAATSSRAQSQQLRVATYNASLNRQAAGDLVRDLSTPDNTQARTIAEVVQRTRPDILLLNEFDFVPDHEAIDLFRDNYLEVGQDGADPIDYPYAFVAPSNTGVPSGFDLNNDGSVGGPDDAFGFGFFEGQFGMAVLSRHPIAAAERVRTFQQFRWKDMPGALLPDDPGTVAPDDWFTPEELDVVRLSSKSHWDVPIRVGTRTVHLLASHPTPPTFDGAEDRNGRRNHDEIRFWADYVHPARSGYIYDDGGVRGGLRPGTPFVIAGDQNSDPLDGDSVPGAIDQLLDHPLVRDPLPSSQGAVEAAAEQGGANLTHRSPARYDTADFLDDPAPGNLRADYVLPSRRLKVLDSGVFWPVRSDPLWRLVGEFPFPSSDHRLVWVDVRLP